MRDQGDRGGRGRGVSDVVFRSLIDDHFFKKFKIISHKSLCRYVFQRISCNAPNGTSTSGRNGGRYGTPSSGDKPRGGRHGGGGRGGRSGNSPHTNNANTPARLPGGGGSAGSRAAFDRGRIFNSGGQQAVRYEIEKVLNTAKTKGRKLLWKVGPPHGDQHHRFHLTAFLTGLTQFIEHQLEQRAVSGQDSDDKRRYDAGTSRSTSTPISRQKDEFVEGFSLGEFSALALKDEDVDLDIEESKIRSSPASPTCTESSSSTSRVWWPSSLSLVTSPLIDAASLPRNEVASKEEQEVLATLAAAAEQQRQRSQPQEGPLELSLRLERLDLTDVEASMLADWVEKHFNRNTAVIRKLWLFGNKLCDDGAAAVARILALGTVIECHLSHNLITLIGAQKLLETVPVGIEKEERILFKGDESKAVVKDSRNRTSLTALWLRLEWNRISLSGLVNLLEAQHAKRGLLCDVPEAAREDAAPPLPTLPDYLITAKGQRKNINDFNDAVQQGSTEKQEEGEMAATPPFSRGQYQGQTNNKKSNANSANTRSTRNQLNYIIEQCHCRLPWVSSQFETPSEAAVLAEAKNLWGSKESDPGSVDDISTRTEGSSIQISMSGLNGEHSSNDSTTSSKISKGILHSSLQPPPPSSSSAGPLLLVPDTSALLAMAGADLSVAAPTFFTLEWLFNLSNRGLFGRILPPREQVFIIVPASVATQLDALKADAGARGAVRRFMSKGLDDMGPSGANFLTMLGAHEGEGLVLEHEAEVAGSRGADVGSRGQATDHRIVEVGLYFQQECVNAALRGEASTAAATRMELEEERGEEDGKVRGREEEQKAHFSSSLPVILLTSDNGQQALAKAHGLPAVRMSDLAAIKAQVLGHLEAGKALTASVLRAALRPTAVAALGKVAARSLQMEFDGAISCLRAAIEHLALAQRREMALREQLLSGLNGQQICLERVDAESAAEIEAAQELIVALEKRLKEWGGLIRSHQVASRVLQWSALT